MVAMRLPVTVVLFTALLFGCGQRADAVHANELDYAEIITPIGWRLRINGDGSGTLTHRQYPAHHLHYPRETFYPAPARRIVSRCGNNGPRHACSRLEYYEALRDRSRRCGCADHNWVRITVEEALRNMQVAVEDEGSLRSCRMLRREWLASR